MLTFVDFCSEKEGTRASHLTIWFSFTVDARVGVEPRVDVPKRRQSRAAEAPPRGTRTADIKLSTSSSVKSDQYLGDKYPVPADTMALNNGGSTSAPSAFAIRSATVERITNETKIQCSLSLDVHPTLAPQTINVKTGIGFLDHVSAREQPSTASQILRQPTLTCATSCHCTYTPPLRCSTLLPSTVACP